MNYHETFNLNMLIIILIVYSKSLILLRNVLLRPINLFNQNMISRIFTPILPQIKLNQDTMLMACLRLCCVSLTRTHWLK